MDIFNTEKQFTSFYLDLDWDRLDSLLKSSDAHLIVTSYDGIPLDDDVSGQYQIRLFMDLELVAICNADEYNGISDVELHPSFANHRQLITQLFSGYLLAPEFLFEISEFNATSLIVRQALRDGQYAVRTVNGDEVLRFNRVPRAMLMTKEPLLVWSILKEGEVRL